MAIAFAMTSQQNVVVVPPNGVSGSGGFIGARRVNISERQSYVFDDGKLSQDELRRATTLVSQCRVLRIVGNFGGTDWRSWDAEGKLLSTKSSDVPPGIFDEAKRGIRFAEIRQDNVNLEIKNHNVSEVPSLIEFGSRVTFVDGINKTATFWVPIGSGGSSYTDIAFSLQLKENTGVTIPLQQGAKVSVGSVDFEVAKLDHSEKSKRTMDVLTVREKGGGFPHNFCLASDIDWKENESKFGALGSKGVNPYDFYCGESTGVSSEFPGEVRHILSVATALKNWKSVEIQRATVVSASFGHVALNPTP